MVLHRPVELAGLLGKRTAQPLCLSASGTIGRRYDSTMNLRKRKNHSVSFQHWGWTANTLCFAVAGESFVLTSPFIERRYRKVAQAPIANIREQNSSGLIEVFVLHFGNPS